VKSEFLAQPLRISGKNYVDRVVIDAALISAGQTGGLPVSERIRSGCNSHRYPFGTKDLCNGLP